MNPIKQPKFKIGQKVKTPRTLYGEFEGTIIKFQRVFKSIDSTLCIEESTIKSIQLPHTFDGETLTVNYPEQDFGDFIYKARTQVSKFYGYSYTVRSAKMLTTFSERSLKLIS